MNTPPADDPTNETATDTVDELDGESKNRVYLPPDLMPDIKAGDPVEATIKGTIVDDGGGQLCIQVEELNDTPLDDQEPNPQDDGSPEATEKALTAKAIEMSNRKPGY